MTLPEKHSGPFACMLIVCARRAPWCFAMVAVCCDTFDEFTVAVLRNVKGAVKERGSGEERGFKGGRKVSNGGIYRTEILELV